MSQKILRKNEVLKGKCQWGKEAKFGDGLQRRWKEDKVEKERVNRLR